MAALPLPGLDTLDFGRPKLREAEASASAVPLLREASRSVTAAEARARSKALGCAR